MHQAAFYRTCPEGDPNLTQLKPDPNQNLIPGLDYVLGFGFLKGSDAVEAHAVRNCEL